MFYEEKLINGILMFRTTPSGEWQQMSIEQLSKKYYSLKQASQRVIRMNDVSNDARNLLSDTLLS